MEADEPGGRSLGRLRAALAPSSTFPWKKPRYELALVALVALVALSPVNPVDTQDESRVCLTQAMLHGHLSADACLARSYDRSSYHGHLYSDKAPGLSIIALPAVAIVNPGPDRRWGNDDLRLWLERVLTVGLCFLAAAFLVGRVAEGLAPGFGGIALVGFALGTLAGPLAASGFEHDVSGALGFGAFLAAWRRRPGLAGLLAGIEVLVDYEAGLVVLLIAAYVALTGWRPLRRYVLGVVPAAVVLGAYDWAAFGAPWHLSYRYIANPLGELQNTGVFGIGVPHVFGIVELLAGSGGLLVVSPLVILAAYGLWLLARDRRAEAVLCAAVVLVYLVVDSAYFQPYGGPPLGPRFIVPALPFLAIGLAPALRARPAFGIVAVAVSLVAVTALEFVWSDGYQVTSSIWNALWHVPSELGRSAYVRGIVPNVLDRLGTSPAQAALVVAVCTLAAFALAVSSGPGPALRRRSARVVRRRRRAVAVAACVAVIAGADACAVLAYPYGGRTYAAGLPDLVVSISGSTPVAVPGDEVNFVVTVSNRSRVEMTSVYLTLRFPGGMTLLGLPVYPTGPHCTGTSTLVCSLVNLAPQSSMPVRLGVRIGQGGTLTLGASASAGAVPGAHNASYPVLVGA